MKCVICGNEKSIFSVIGLDGSICSRCNEHLNMYTYDNPAVAKAYCLWILVTKVLAKKKMYHENLPIGIRNLNYIIPMIAVLNIKHFIAN